MKKDWKLLIAGVLGCIMLYAVPAYFFKYWLGYFMATGGAGIFLFFLLRKTEDLKSYRRITTITSITLLFTLSIALSGLMYFKSQNQREINQRVRNIIDSGTIGIQVQNDLLQSLKIHLDQNLPVDEAFEEHMGDRLNEDGSIDPADPDAYGVKNFFFYYQSSNDEVKLLAVSRISEGRDPGFLNHNGESGLLQYQGSLKSEGVDYERIN
ncbi:hypothetical protein AB2B38_007975 [Balneola sp. MJW-20]|uniref:hypothetical protein n=1 Tax=Gracilimonas aurantiaca TaxID=3234185 RepID=UPI0034656C83